MSLSLLFINQILFAQTELIKKQKFISEVVCENGILKFKDKKQMRDYAQQLASIPNEIRNGIEMEWKFNSIYKLIVNANEIQNTYFDQLETNPNAKIDQNYISIELKNLIETNILKKTKVPNEDLYFYETKLIEAPLAPVLNKDGIVIIGNKAYQYNENLIKITDVTNVNALLNKKVDLTKIKVIDFSGSTRISGVASSFLYDAAYTNKTTDNIRLYKIGTNKFILSRATYSVYVDGTDVDGNVISQDANFYVELFALRRNGPGNTLAFRNNFRGKFDMWGTSWQLGYSVGGINNDNTTYDVNLIDGITQPNQILTFGWWYREANTQIFDDQLGPFVINPNTFIGSRVSPSYVTSDNTAYGFDTEVKHNYAAVYLYPSGTIQIAGIDPNNSNAKSKYFTCLIKPRLFNLGGQFKESNDPTITHLNAISNFNF